MMSEGGVWRQWVSAIVVGLVLGVGVVTVCVLRDRGASSPPSNLPQAVDPCDAGRGAAGSASLDAGTVDRPGAVVAGETAKTEDAEPAEKTTTASEPKRTAPSRSAPVAAERSETPKAPTGRMIRGRLLDTNGRPIAGYVTLEGVVSDVNVAPDSVFAIAEPADLPREGLIGCARDASDTMGLRFLWPSDNPDEELVLVLEPYGNLVGRVVGADGNPMPDARLDLQARMVNNSWRGGDAAIDPPVIGDDGYFLFDRVPVGLRVRVTGHRGLLKGQSRQLDLTPGVPMDAGEITMRGSRSGQGTIQGRITDETRRPLTNHSIQIRVGRTSQWLRTDADGYFVLTDLPRGRKLTVKIEVDGYGSWSRKAVPDDFHCDFRLCPQGWDIVGKEALPLFAGTWFNHASTTLEQLRGQVVVLAFRDLVGKTDRGLGRLRDLQNEFSSEGLLIVAIYNCLPVSSRQAEEIVTGFLTGLFEGAPMAGLLDADPALVADLMAGGRPTGGAAGATHWMYQVHTRPMFFLIDKAGVVRHCTANAGELREWIERLLGE